ncbi:MAG: hypothetical protein NTZ16_15730, partial [Verrucomicrobia bacterium]|nr:hypothetical protein [Verrucomicrobiota bacterium]
KDDLGEHNNLAAKMPEKVEALRKLLHDWRTEVKAQMPTPNPNYSPADTTKPERKKKGKAGKKSVSLSNPSIVSPLLAARADD